MRITTNLINIIDIVYTRDSVIAKVTPKVGIEYC